MPAFVSFLSLGQNRAQPRVWIENGRLGRLGLLPGTRMKVERRAGRLTLTSAPDGTHTVSGRPNGTPIIDLNSSRILGGLIGFDEIRVRASFGRIDLAPSFQGFHLARGKQTLDEVRVLHLFAGGGTFSSALKGLRRVREVGAVEINSRYAHWLDATHPGCETIIVADVRKVTPFEVPAHDLLVAGIPCSDTSNLGRTRKGLAGKPEAGELSDLFIPVMNIVSSRRPAAVVLENVPNYQRDPMGLIIRRHLTALGYHVTETILNPNADWGDIQDRRRWCLIATLKPGFALRIPGTPCTRAVAEFLDAANDEADAADCARTAKTVAGLQVREIQHKAVGNGFRFNVLDPNSTRIPTITRSCKKGNLQGPWVKTEHGLRLLRKSELARLSGHDLPEGIPATTAAEIVGQGCTVATWRAVFRQVVEFLCGEYGHHVV